jgi:hypothetical protein
VFYCDLSRYTTSTAHPDKFFQKILNIFKKKRDNNNEQKDPCQGDEDTREAMA